jgi:hypothetical protein
MPVCVTFSGFSPFNHFSTDINDSRLLHKKPIAAASSPALRNGCAVMFGSQLQSSNNTQIGKTAMNEVFVAVTEIVKSHVIEPPVKLSAGQKEKKWRVKRNR